MERLGLIAGNGRFPILVAQNAKAQGVSVVAVGIRGETLPEVEQVADQFYSIGLAKVGKLIRIFKKEGITKAVMAGGVTKTRMYSPTRYLDLMPDRRTIKLWFYTVRDRKDHSLLGAVADELASEGVELQSSLLYVPELVPTEGCLTKRQPNRREKLDIEFGWELAKASASLQIGQCVVVKERAVVAVEAIEGTDAALRRAGELARKGTTIVKVSKPDQDVRFDVPTVGLRTIRTMREIGATALAVQAGMTLVLDREEAVAEADRAKITIVAR